MTNVLIVYLHDLGFAALLTALVIQAMLLRPQTDALTARRLALADAVYGGAALTLLGSGLLRVFAGVKPAAYYGQNWIFHVKVTVFLLLVLLSIYPSVRFFKQRRLNADARATYPPAVKRLVAVEIVLALALPLLGVLMARGYGFGG